MKNIKQSAWTKDEDILLAKTVLQHIQEGKTQLAAFNDVAKQLSRTPGACGFRWNATLRKKYDKDIEQAKLLRKKSNKVEKSLQSFTTKTDLNEQIHTAISLLQTLSPKAQFLNEQKYTSALIKQLQHENRLLKKKLLRYEEAWQEIQKIGMWVYNRDE